MRRDGAGSTAPRARIVCKIDEREWIEREKKTKSAEAAAGQQDSEQQQQATDDHRDGDDGDDGDGRVVEVDGKRLIPASCA